jgi:hypothetical protein
VEKDDKGKMHANSSGKRNCFNCSGDNHWVVNCPNLTDAQRNELAGMAHVSAGNNEFKGLGFLQNESVNPRVVAAHKTLDPHQLNLDSTLSFHQEFREEHLNNLWLAGATLCANFNAGTNFDTKKGCNHDLFDLWLVFNGIAKDLLSATPPVATELSPPPGAKKSPSSKRRAMYAADSPTSKCSPLTPWP